eukprot:scaffold23580_cov40-Cyclotella_meneghiniana.AAC.2
MNPQTSSSASATSMRGTADKRKLWRGFNNTNTNNEGNHDASTNYNNDTTRLLERIDEEESSLPPNHFKGGGQSNISGNAAELASLLRRNQRGDDHHHQAINTTTTKATITTTTDTNKDITISPSGIAIISALNIIHFALRDELLKALSLLYPMQYTKQRLNLSKIPIFPKTFNLVAV